ncbi:carboxypeptidase-like regulatory domain-containing protein [Hymenobacter humi]|uniref:Carboxypeptidase-like regulatory domain-containing protein n=1 Tax=Hymenobacter humi TaxID=1411620 RepID=A0ABW2UAD6_9BACT
MAWSQEVARYTVSGTVRGARGEVLPGASVAVPALNTGTAADSLGHFSLLLPAGRHDLVVAFVGYQQIARALNLSRNQRLNFVLEESGNELGEVVVQGAVTLEEKLKTTQMGVERVSIREAKLLPALFGEVDILKTLQLKPGIQSGGEGTSGLFVRGGSADQNLVLLDNALVYNPNHLFGLFSVFNSDAVQSVDLYKSGFPAQFGGRLSSVVDVKLREGDRQHYVATGGVGLISSRLTYEGPINKGKGSFIVSGRRTYFDIFTRALNEANKNKEDYSPIPDYYFYDFNAKANYTLGEKDQVFLTGYLGRDTFGFNSPGGFNFDFSWGNTVGTLRWNHVFRPSCLSTPRSRCPITSTTSPTGSTSSALRWARASPTTPAAPTSSTRPTSGTCSRPAPSLPTTNSAWAVSTPTPATGASTSGPMCITSARRLRFTPPTTTKPATSCRLEGGLRLTGFGSGQKLYGGFEPRGSARYSLNDRTTLKASYAQMYQYVHLVTNSGASLPTDIWYPSRLSVKPQRSQQVSTGASFLLGQGKYLLTNEVYYKWGRNQVDFRDGAQLFVNPEPGRRIHLWQKLELRQRAVPGKENRQNHRLGRLHAGLELAQFSAPARHGRRQQRPRLSPQLRPPPQPDGGAAARAQRPHQPHGQLYLHVGQSYHAAVGPLWHAGHSGLARGRRPAPGASLPRPQLVPPHPLPPPRPGRGVQNRLPPQPGPDPEHLQRLQPPQRLLRVF